MALLERLVTYLFSTSGNLFSTRKITGALASAGRKTSNDTVDNYIKALEEAFALVGVQQTGLAGKRVLSHCASSMPLTRGCATCRTGSLRAISGFSWKVSCSWSF